MSEKDFDNIFREKLESVAPEYDEAAWGALATQLPPPALSFWQRVPQWFWLNSAFWLLFTGFNFWFWHWQSTRMEERWYMLQQNRQENLNEQQLDRLLQRQKALFGDTLVVKDTVWIMQGTSGGGYSSSTRMLPLNNIGNSNLTPAFALAGSFPALANGNPRLQGYAPPAPDWYVGDNTRLATTADGTGQQQATSDTAGLNGNGSPARTGALYAPAGYTGREPNQRNTGINHLTGNSGGEALFGEDAYKTGTRRQFAPGKEGEMAGLQPLPGHFALKDSLRDGQPEKVKHVPVPEAAPKKQTLWQQIAETETAFGISAGLSVMVPRLETGDPYPWTVPGVQAAFWLGQRLSLQAGVQLASMQYDLDIDLDDVEDLQQYAVLPGWQNFAEEPENADVKTRQLLFPVSLQYRWPLSGKWWAHVRGGVASRFIFNQRADYFADEMEDEPMFTGSTRLNRFDSGFATFGAGATYQINRSLGIGLSGEYWRGLHPSGVEGREVNAFGTNLRLLWLLGR